MDILKQLLKELLINNAVSSLYLKRVIRKFWVRGELIDEF
jgi:hypothetical protein